MWIVTESACKAAVSMADAVRLVESAFAAASAGEVLAFPPLFGRGADPTCRFGVKAGVDIARTRAGAKLGSYWPGNPRRGLPAHGSTTLLLDDETGRVAALVSATHLNALRTAAADAVGVRWLARPDSASVAIVGPGNQAWWDLSAVRQERPITTVRVWGRDPAQAEAFAGRARAAGLDAAAADLETAVRQADIVITTTAARQPLVRRGWVRPGTHVSAMGADGPGKQELEVALVAAASLFADLVEQSTSLGEFQHAIAATAVTREAIRPLGDVIRGLAPGRRTAKEITIFDSSGIAAQDLAIADFALRAAMAMGRTTEVDLFDG